MEGYKNINELQELPKVVVYAGFWTRFFAYFIDCLILLIPAFLLRLLIDGEIFTESSWTYTIVSGIVDWLYFAILESGKKQATLGKQLLDIKVIAVDGNRISFGRATARHFSKILSAILLLIGFIMIAFDSRKQGLHDKIAETLVIE